MTLAPPVAEAQAPSLPPLRLPPELRLTPERFALVCDANPEAVLELAAVGRLITLTPTGGETSHCNSRLLTRLQNWADRQGGWMVFASSGGFRLDDGSVLSPDVSVPCAARWPPTWPTAPGWAGCCLPSSGL